MTKRSQAFAARGGRAGGSRGSAAIGGWFTPPRDPPVVAETKWRFARLKFGVSAAGDDGAITNYTGANVFEGLKAQQGLNVTAALSACRILQVMSYALQGVGDTGGQTYPSTKIRAYSPLEDGGQGVLLEQREDSGTLRDVAKIGYKFPKHLQERVLGGSATAYFAQVENYHCSRGIVYIDVMWATVPN
eukprot:285759_1